MWSGYDSDMSYGCVFDWWYSDSKEYKCFKAIGGKEEIDKRFVDWFVRNKIKLEDKIGDFSWVWL